MWDLAFQFVILPAIGALGVKLFGAAVWVRIKDRAAEIMADPANKITSPREALMAAFWEVWRIKLERQVDELEQLQREGALEARAAEQRGRENAEGMDITIVERDGSEKWSKPFGDKP